jgi:hypothetical protein
MTVNLKKIFYAYGLYLKFGLYRIPVYSKFSLGRQDTLSRFQPNLSLLLHVIFNTGCLAGDQQIPNAIVLGSTQQGLYRIPVYSKFSLGRLHCIRSIDKSWMLHASYQQ